MEKEEEKKKKKKKKPSGRQSSLLLLHRINTLHWNKAMDMFCFYLHLEGTTMAENVFHANMNQKSSQYFFKYIRIYIYIQQHSLYVSFVVREAQLRLVLHITISFADWFKHITVSFAATYLSKHYVFIIQAAILGIISIYIL